MDGAFVGGPDGLYDKGSPLHIQAPWREWPNKTRVRITVEEIGAGGGEGKGGGK